MNTPIYYAISNNHLDALTLLLDHGAIIDCGHIYESRNPNDLVDSIISIMAKNNQVDMLDALLSHDIDLFGDNGATHYKGYTALHQIIEHGWVDAIDVLLKHGANIDQVSADWDDLGDFIGVLVGEACHCEPRYKEEWLNNYQLIYITPLHLAVFLGNDDCINKLLSNGADKSILDCGGLTARDISIMTMRFHLTDRLKPQ